MRSVVAVAVLLPSSPQCLPSPGEGVGHVQWLLLCHLHGALDGRHRRRVQSEGTGGRVIVPRRHRARLRPQQVGVWMSSGQWAVGSGQGAVGRPGGRVTNGRTILRRK